MNYLSDKIIDDQGNVKTVAGGQDARLYYIDVYGQRKKYLLQGEVSGGGEGGISEDEVREISRSIAQEEIQTFKDSELDDYVLQEEGEDDNGDVDYIQLLTSCSESEIDFIPEEYNDIIPTIGSEQRCMYILHVVINGIKIPTNYVYFRAEGIPKANSFQLHINVDESIRRQGIAFKLYQAFIRINGSACSLFKNRTSTFYDENNTTIPSDVAISGLWKKLASLPNIKVIALKRKGEVVGVKAIRI